MPPMSTRSRATTMAKIGRPMKKLTMDRRSRGVNVPEPRRYGPGEATRRSSQAGRRHEEPLAGTAVVGFAAGPEVFSGGAGAGADPRAGWATTGLFEGGVFGSLSAAPRIRMRGLSSGSGTSDSE